MSVGQIIAGSIGDIIVRQKTGEEIELGDLFIAGDKKKVLLQAYDLRYGSQLGDSSRALIAGMSLEGTPVQLMEANIANYNLAHLKPLVVIENGNAFSPKNLPLFFSDIKRITEKDLSFLTKPEDAIYAGKLRSGSKQLNVEIYLPQQALQHHILITSSTGKGKSNIMKVLSSSIIDKGSSSLLILDPHDEYKELNTIRYSTKPEPGSMTLTINISILRPSHLYGIMSLSDAQKEALSSYHNKFGKEWVKSLLTEQIENVRPETVEVLRRKFAVVLGIRPDEYKGVFSETAGQTTVKDICDALENGKSVVIDTSMLGSELELVVGSILTRELFNRYKRYKTENKKPRVVGVVVEEAPRVIGRDVLQQGPNIFSTIAREGRKFNVGLIAITQLPSLIPKDILANMNTKIILGMELNSERQSIIESASQDLSKDDRNIASLNKGEAIISSTFTNFAVPIKVPLFQAKKESLKQYPHRNRPTHRVRSYRSFEGMS
jgi:hypothetical protein